MYLSDTSAQQSGGQQQQQIVVVLAVSVLVVLLIDTSISLLHSQLGFKCSTASMKAAMDGPVSHIKREEKESPNMHKLLQDSQDPIVAQTLKSMEQVLGEVRMRSWQDSQSQRKGVMLWIQLDCCTFFKT